MPASDVGDQYSVWVGLVYIFNLIVGTGALTLPAVFARAGWALSTISLVFLAFMSFLNVTYVLETMACANAVLKWKRLQVIKRGSVQEYDSDDDEIQPHQNYGDSEQPLVGEAPSLYYSLDKRVELGEMANLFLTGKGRTLFYCTLCVYLYGDLSIYAAAVAKSIMDVICVHNNDLNNSASIGGPGPARRAPGYAAFGSAYVIRRVRLLIYVSPFAARPRQPRPR
ncbi:Transmembrane protein 104 homolog [Eumeta japonica]|uniref:Transmembrane protein 104 homolog n=1 Tax=Eumeta variegata TaxID=151549 RepID=A0A4C1VJ29_EUMVA|nr:Transmembrane protein 104 homolog [Eumeta japonica]